jgi:membrane protein implicated in regulation of membrane protease activity
MVAVVVMEVEEVAVVKVKEEESWMYYHWAATVAATVVDWMPSWFDALLALFWMLSLFCLMFGKRKREREETKRRKEERRKKKRKAKEEETKCDVK